MALHIDTKQGILTTLKNGTSKARVINLPELGWDLEKNVEFAAQIPCFTGGGFPLPVDVLLRSDEGQALALILTDIPMEDENKLRTIADLYTNSAKRQYGQRPAIYFVGDGQCKAAHGLLGTFQNDPQLMRKDVYVEFIASHNIQETIVFHTLLEDADLTKKFLSGTLNAEALNAVLANILEKAKKAGFSNYYNTLCPDDEAKKSLPKQAVLLAGLGEEQYIQFIKQQVHLLREALYTKSYRILQKGVADDTWLPIPKHPSMESQMLDWAFSFHGWNRAKDIRKNCTVPCYLEPSMELLADYAFLDPNGKPILLFLRDTLNLNQEKAFITAEFYARSFKAAYGIVPFVVFYSKNGATLKMGAMSGGFNPIAQVLPKIQLAAQVACVNITEHRAWSELIPHIPALQAIPDDQQRFAQQMDWIHESVAETNKLLEDDAFVKKAFQQISGDTQLLEEAFWKQMNGEHNYLENRKQELSLIRTVVADKRIAAGIL